MLEQNQVKLRPIQEDDLPQLVEWKNNREISHLTGGYMPVTLTQEAIRYELEQESSSKYTFLIEIYDKTAIGYCGLMGVEPVSRRAELFIRIGYKEKQGQGYGKETLKSLLSFAFEDLNLNRLFITVFTDNTKAIALFEMLGFKKEGTLRSHQYAQGQYKNMVMMGLLRAEWEKI